MGRKDYVADLAYASSQNIIGIVSVAKGGEDGELRVCYTPPDRDPIDITLICSDVSSYPSENVYYITTEDSMEVPAGVGAVLEKIQTSSMGMRIQILLSAISEDLGRHFSMGTRDNPVGLDSDTEIAMHLSEDLDIEDESDGSEGSEAFPDSDIDSDAEKPTKSKLSSEAAGRLNRRIRADLRAVKRAGLRVGILDGAKADSVSSIISISTKVDKLGLSEEAIQAWDLEPQQYIIILVRYTNGYQSFEDVIAEAAEQSKIFYRIGVGKKYKPTLAEALAAFTDSKKYDPPLTNPQDSRESRAGFSSLFISSSLNEFVNKSFVSLLKIRNTVGVGWAGAKSWLNEKQSSMGSNSVPSDSVYNQDALDNQKSLPDIISQDHFTDHGNEQMSFLLIAAQFTLRYLVRCTEYCLVCHDRIEGDFEALKPYVCDKPLCLYQYMSLGFGPSVEHEILTQPYVVDLLTSFCYAGACGRRFREYPTGMALLVPPVTYRVTRECYNVHKYQGFAPSVVYPKTLASAMEVRFDAGRQEIIFDGRAYDKSPVKKGDWVVVSIVGRVPTHHRVEDTLQYPSVTLSKEATSFNIFGANANVPTPATTPPPQNTISAYVVPYSENFDDMNPESKAEIIVDLLKTLPSMKEMRSYLLNQSRSAEPSLRAWNDRISPAALGILRWIVASNRSCIVQVDKCPDQNDTDAIMAKVRVDQRIGHIAPSYVQFRFAQGSPDKEQRFLNALKEQQANLNMAYPTIFAWHGSKLENWHSIIRSGLDYKDTLNGRSYGHGVYHARDQNTSTNYAAAAAPNTWQGSSLKITSAMSLNEIVNCPTQFVSNAPFYVVQHIDWIQCRYLLVQVSAGTAPGNDNAYPHASSNTTASVDGNRKDDISQDPRYQATSSLGRTIAIPSCAITTSNRFRADINEVLQSKSKLAELKTILKGKLSQSNGDSSLMDVSDDDEMEDIAFFMSDSETGGSKTKLPQIPLTDFVPGSLDHSSLPMLDEPSYATPMATKALQRNLKEVLTIQKKTPLHELGWYLDERLVNNMYQWIVELHSFDPSLPLAQDMKASGVTSVVLEIRFGKDYPHSPPFVRVIRPRFLPFSAGGGGHVTAGGAMCMELLTNSGWSAVSSIESVLLQVRMAMMNLEPRPARLETKTKRQCDYQVGEAIEAYKRACQQHGWQIPLDFGDFSSTHLTAGTSGGY